MGPDKRTALPAGKRFSAARELRVQVAIACHCLIFWGRSEIEKRAISDAAVSQIHGVLNWLTTPILGSRIVLLLALNA
jgi:hypothetical protein